MLREMKSYAHLKQGQNGTKGLMEKYSDALLCVRYRYDAVRGVRMKTVELIVEEKPGNARLNVLVPLHVPASDMRLRAMVKTVGGRWDPEKKLWFVRYGTIADGPLENHIHVDKSVKQPRGKNHIYLDGK